MISTLLVKAMQVYVTSKLVLINTIFHSS